MERLDTILTYHSAEDRSLNPEIAPLDAQANWKEVLLKIVKESFSETKTGLLLSRVPSVLRENGIEPSRVFGSYKVRYFLETFGSPELSLIQNETNPALWVLIPGDVKLESSNSAYFPTITPAGSPRPTRFKASVWKAFVSVLAAGHRRWIQLSPRVLFVDLPEGQEIGAIPIETEFVRTDDLFLENAEVTSRIERWAAQHSIPLSQLTHREDMIDDGRRRMAGDNVLRAFLIALSEEQRRRVLIPSDIIQNFL